jgi:hypothetical protein
MGELLSAQPRWMPAARECWEHAGLRCAVIASPIGGWNGYVQLPWGHPWRARGWLDEELLAVGLTWGPSEDGWVGFDTAHAGDAWHPDDDAPPYEPAWWPWPAPHELAAEVAEGLARLRRLAAGSLGRELWTLPRLRAKVDQLAEVLARLESWERS